MIPSIRGVRSPVKRGGAEKYVLLSLVSFAISVILTRLFLELTGYPQLGNSELHIGHVLWGGLLLFIASLLPIILANRWVFNASAVLSGLGVGLFIDEVGKFITQSNDYFYPPAAPIIYAFFLLTVLLYLNIRRQRVSEARSELYDILEGLTEVLDRDLDPSEREALKHRLLNITRENQDHNLQSLAIALADYLEGEQLHLVETHIPFPQRVALGVKNRFDQILTQPRLKTFLIIALGSMGVIAIIDFLLLLWAIPTHRHGIEVLISPLVTRGELRSAWDALWFVIRTILEGGTGTLLIVSGGLLAIGQTRKGIQIASITLVIWLTEINLLVFYLDQFRAVINTLIQFFILLIIVYYRDRFLKPFPPVAPPRPEPPKYGEISDE